MEQFQHIGEVLGSIRALMVFGDEIRINPRQCRMLVDVFEAAFAGIAEEMRHNLRLDEKLTKWKPLEHPLRELHRVFRDGEQYIRQCLDPKDWWGRSFSLSQSADCVNLHLYNLLWCIPVVLEAIESVSETTGDGHDEIYRRRLVFSNKYDKELMEPKLFQQRFGKLYLVSQEMCRRMDSVAKEDGWVLSETIAAMRSSMSKQENRLAELLTSPKGKIQPISILVNSPDYQVRRRLGSSSKFKEIQWMGESFALKHVIGDVQQSMPEISLLSSITHPNVMHYLYLFSDDEEKECFLVMELMSKNLSSYIKEVCNPRRKAPFPLLTAVDIMLQIARGMEYLHFRNICHGDLNPSNILVKTKNNSSPDGYVHVKVAGVGLSAANNHTPNGLPSPAGDSNPGIWYAPEVLTDQDQPATAEASKAKKYTQKADVYSFAMICFELLTGKTPFEEGHLQGDKMSRNIRAGERPLFPFPSPRFLTNMTKRCWHSDPIQRPSFSSICRMLRYLKRFMIMNPDNGLPDPPSPPVDYFDIDMSLTRKFVTWQRREALHVSDIPFEMYAYRVIERERTSANLKEKSSDSGSDASVSGEDNGFHATIPEDNLSLSHTSTSSGSGKSTINVPSSCNLTSASNASSNGHKKTVIKKMEVKPQSSKQTGNHNLKMKTGGQSPRLLSYGRGMRMKSENQLQTITSAAMSPVRRRPGPASDSEL